MEQSSVGQERCRLIEALQGPVGGEPALEVRGDARGPMAPGTRADSSPPIPLTWLLEPGIREHCHLLAVSSISGKRRNATSGHSDRWCPGVWSR